MSWFEFLRVRGYTLVRRGGLTTPTLLAGAVSSETEVATVLAPEVGIAEADKKVQFMDRAILTFLWKKCRANPGCYN